MAWVCILPSADDSLYVGHTEDLASRVRMHNEGHGGAYTAARRPVVVVYFEEFGTLREARDRERQIKRWSGKKKEALIARDSRALKGLSRSHQRH